jgi:hypothetical protein
MRLAPTNLYILNLENEIVIYSLQQRSPNITLNLDDAVEFSIYRVSLNDSLSI